MKLHGNARLSVKGRELLIERKWLARYRAEGEEGLLDRSSAPGLWPTAPTSGASRRSPRRAGCG
jgi:hypothetical protein